MENKQSLLIMLVFIIAILSLALAVSIGYIFATAGDNEVDSRLTNANVKIRPDDDELGKKNLYDNDQIFNLKSDGDGKNHVIKVGVEIQYYKKVRGIKNTREKIDFYDGLIKELICTYFQNKTLADVMKEDAKQLAKQELTAQINELLLSSENVMKDIVYTIVFDEWFYQ